MEEIPGARWVQRGRKKVGHLWVQRGKKKTGHLQGPSPHQPGPDWGPGKVEEIPGAEWVQRVRKKTRYLQGPPPHQPGPDWGPGKVEEIHGALCALPADVEPAERSCHEAIR